MAAVLAGGPGSTLSHRSAAALHGVIEAGRTVADVTAPTRRSSRPGIDLHEGVLPEDERTIHDGIPVTTVARTLLDLATVLDDERLAQAVGKAEALGLGDTTSLPDLMCRYPSRRGAVALRAILADARIGMDLARSELEIRFLAFPRDRDLPRPEVKCPDHGAWEEDRGRLPVARGTARRRARQPCPPFGLEGSRRGSSARLRPRCCRDAHGACDLAPPPPGRGQARGRAPCCPGRRRPAPPR